MLDYYDRLQVAELEGDMFTALVGQDAAAGVRVHARLVAARARLAAKQAAAVQD